MNTKRAVLSGFYNATVLRDSLNDQGIGHVLIKLQSSGYAVWGVFGNSTSYASFDNFDEATEWFVNKWLPRGHKGD
jgi:hypothetical protein